VRPALWCYIRLVFLIGMTTAGLVLLPLGLLLLGHFLLRESIDRSLIGGLLLAAIGLLYLVLPLVAIRTVTQAALDGIQRQADRLAEQIQGHE
jgi:drug/metabolite transporter (DMT)-like permease